MKVVYLLLAVALIIGVQDVYFWNIHYYVNGKPVESLQLHPGDKVVIEGYFKNTETPDQSIVVEYLWNGKKETIKTINHKFKIEFTAPDWSEYGWCNKEEAILLVRAHDPQYSWVRFIVKAKCLCTSGKLTVQITNIDSVMLSMMSWVYNILQIFLS